MSTLWAPSSVTKAASVDMHAGAGVAACHVHAGIHFWWCSASRFTQLSQFWQAATMSYVNLFSIYKHQHHNFTTKRVDSIPRQYHFNITVQIRWERWHRKRSLGPGWWTSHVIFFHQIHKAVTSAPSLDLGPSAPFFWDCRTSGSWCCGRARL